MFFPHCSASFEIHSLLLIKGNIGVLWELYWKGMPLKHGAALYEGILGDDSPPSP